MNVREAQLEDVPVLLALAIQDIGGQAAERAWLGKLCIEDIIQNKERGEEIV